MESVTQRYDEQITFDAQMEDFMERNPHYATPGAKQYWQRIKLGYVLLAVGTVIGIWAFTNLSQHNLKTQLNKAAVEGCISSIKIYHKYNDLTNSIILTRQQSVIRDIASHDKAQERIDREAVKRYKMDLIVPPTPAQCKLAVIVK